MSVRLGLLAGLALLPVVDAAQLILPAIRDTSIFSELPDNGSGEGRFLIAGVNKAGDPRRGLIAFDIAGSLPAGATVSSAALFLKVAKIPDELFVATTQSLHRATTDWGAAGSGGTGRGEPAQPGDATWNANFFGASSWTSPGGDFAAAPSAQFLVPPVIDSEVTFSGPQVAADVQLWLDSPTQNFGWFVNGNEVFDSNARAYYSSDNSNFSNHPQLVVNFTPIPEPRWTLVPAAVLLAALVRRRGDV